MVLRAFLTFLSILTLTLAVPAMAADVGKPAPAFEVKDISGNTQSLAQYKGKIVVLEWNNPGCPFVQKHYNSGNMQSTQSYALEHGVIWLTVNSGGAGKEGYMTAAQAKAEVKQVGGHETAYILDPQGTLGKLYGAKATPHMFVIDAKGILVYAGAIDDVASTDEADIAKAHNYVKAAIDDLTAGKPVQTSQTRAYGCSVKYQD